MSEVPPGPRREDRLRKQPDAREEVRGGEPSGRSHSDGETRESETRPDPLSRNLSRASPSRKGPLSLSRSQSSSLSSVDAAAPPPLETRHLAISAPPTSCHLPIPVHPAQSHPRRRLVPGLAFGPLRLTLYSSCSPSTHSPSSVSTIAIAFVGLCKWRRTRDPFVYPARFTISTELPSCSLTFFPLASVIDS